MTLRKVRPLNLPTRLGSILQECLFMSHDETRIFHKAKCVILQLWSWKVTGALDAKCPFKNAVGTRPGWEKLIMTPSSRGLFELLSSKLSNLRTASYRHHYYMFGWKLPIFKEEEKFWSWRAHSIWKKFLASCEFSRPRIELEKNTISYDKRQTM